MRKLRRLVTAVMGLAVMVSSAFGQTQSSRQYSAPAPTPSAPRTAGATPRPVARLTDAQLESTIRGKFEKSKSANQFKIHVQGGVATIDGKTDVVQHKAAATRMAKSAGAVAVNNKVVVSDAAKQKAAGNLEEGRRRVQVKRGDARSER